jgi:hypothetical protein
VVIFLLSASVAFGQAVSIAAISGAVSSSPVGLRPGGRVAFEPTPVAALEAMAVAGLEPWSPDTLGIGWEAGLGLSGRAWISGAPTDGLFLLGRVSSGISGNPDAQIGPWLALGGGFGGRISSRLNIEATVGPEWMPFDSGRWRTELSIGYVFDKSNQPGTTRHRPRPIPRR